jgi:hypothetical protein
MTSWSYGAGFDFLTLITVTSKSLDPKSLQAQKASDDNLGRKNGE